MRCTALVGVLTAVIACEKDAETPAEVVDPLAGRSRHTIVYSGNMWGDLIECG